MHSNLSFDYIFLIKNKFLIKGAFDKSGIELPDLSNAIKML